MKNLFLITLLFCSILLSSQTYPSLNMTKIGFIDPETVMGVDNIKYSGCWGYQQTSKNKEYAIVGSSTGTYFIDITAPATPTVCDYVAGKHPSACIWREIQTYQNYAYVVSDDAAPNSFQIIDMQYLPDSVHVVYDGKGTYFERAHQLFVSGNKLYVAGITFSNSATANMRVYSLATPTAPTLLRTLSQDYPSISYVHDMYVRTDTVFAHCGNQGMYVYKFTPSNTFSVLGSLTGYTDAGYNHSSSLSRDGKTLVFCDEVPTGLRIKCADVTNLSNITVTSLFRPNNNSQFVGHNPYVVGNKYAFISCYEDGLNLYDISSPASPTLIAYFDTYPQGGANFGNNYGSGSYNGNWGAYPYFNSGLILACDMQNGVFILGAAAFAPSANFTFASNICSGASTTFTNTSTNSPTSFNWNIQGASPASYTLANPVVTFTASGVYSATLIAANASGTNSVVKSITVTATPTVNVSGPSAICAGASATISGGGAATYTWNPGNITGNPIAVTPTANTTYSVTGSNGNCTGSNTKSITVNSLPSVSLSVSSNTICTSGSGGTSIALTGSPSGGTYSGATVSGATFLAPPAVGTYTVGYAYTNTVTACSNSATTNINVFICTGITSLNNNEQGTYLMPNPSSGKFTIAKEGADRFDAIVYNSVGQQLISISDISYKTDVDLSGYAKGMYFVLVRTGSTFQKLKLMIE